ncbi:hypothetical protein FDP41_000589 [Naegleria fowleri]|uniref:Uncharacterized protein n=1 Tax=Naegleria fowleri TaxID=5763 RepID=A0A6A5CGN6_NAEFO|nr:uncharacterized protein FDP41_000589 [Naegleria fowleri]KAF0984690.1 hypothetical protein FDP41_000589 [Naegleria fowleri]
MRRFNSSHHSHLTTSSKYLHHNGQQQELNEHHHRNSTPYWWPLDALLKKMYYSKFTDQSPMNIPQNYDGGNRGDGEDYDDIERGREGMNYELFRDSVPVSLNDGNNHLHHGNDDVDERPSSQNYNDQNSSHRYFTEQPKAKYAALRTHKRFTINPLKACLGSTLTVILLGVMALIILLVVLLLVEKPRQVIVVLSIDGFRYDYLDLYPQYVPTLLNMRKKGVYVDKLKPSFPTKTFPNHYTIATGQYVQSHGMVSNKFYDKKAPFDSKIFTQQLTDPFWWEQGEPIWITAQKQKISTACYDYPASNVQIQGMFPNFYEPVFIHDDYDIQKRISKLRNYLSMTKNHQADAPKLIMYYLGWVDNAAHFHGVPDPSKNLTSESMYFYNALKMVDDMVSNVFQTISDLQLESHVNIIVLSDHGMENVKQKENGIWIQPMLDRYFSYLNMTSLNIYSIADSYTSGTLVDFYVMPNSTDQNARKVAINTLYEGIKGAIDLFSYPCKVYKKEDIPFRYKYTNNSRIPDVLVVSDIGEYSAIDSMFWWGEKADHGYDNEEPAMQAFFQALGPLFKSGGVKAYDSVANIHIHSLLAELLNINPSTRNEGSLDEIKNVLSYEVHR